jgi:hypothetical protein
VAEDAVRSEMVSRPVLAAICDLQGDFQKLQGELIRCLSNFVMVSRCCNGFSLLREQGAFFGICREEQRGIANGGRVGADSTRTRRPHNSIGSQADVEDRKQARRERVGSRPRRLPTLSASRSKGHLPGAGSGGYRANHVGDSR